jgi:homoserine acetyltransferase
MSPADSFISGPPRELLLPEGFHFRHGQTIAPFTIVYETFGELNADRSNAILVCHALSASAHAAGRYSDIEEDKPGWWDGLVGYGKAIDLDQHFVVCVNLPGSPFGTTAPKSIDPTTGRLTARAIRGRPSRTWSSRRKSSSNISASRICAPSPVVRSAACRS